jgi:hypothetical protein
MSGKSIVLVGIIGLCAVAGVRANIAPSDLWSFPLSKTPMTPAQKFAFKHNSAANTYWWCKFTGVTTPHWTEFNGAKNVPSEWNDWVEAGINFTTTGNTPTLKSLEPYQAIVSPTNGSSHPVDYSHNYYSPLQVGAQDYGSWSQDNDVVNIKIHSNGFASDMEIGGKMDLAHQTFIGTFRTQKSRAPLLAGNFSCDFEGYYARK